MGLYMAAVYSVVATAIMLGGGFATKLTPAEFLSVVGTYFVAGAVGGATGGALRELWRTWAGTAVMGMAIGISVFLAMGTLCFGLPLGWGRAEWFSYGMGVVVVSPITAIWYRYKVG